jgi:hypothetical protein
MATLISIVKTAAQQQHATSEMLDCLAESAQPNLT